MTRGWIGVQIQPVTAEIADSLGLKKAQGALVAEPQTGRPGRQGRHQGRRRDHRGQRHSRSRTRAISPAQIGAHGARRDRQARPCFAQGQEKTFTLTLGELAERARGPRRRRDTRDQNGTDVPRLGLSLAPAGEVAGSGNDGVVVTEVDPDGAAAEHGFKTGDVILEVAGKTVGHPADVRKARRRGATKDGKRTVLMRVKSGEGTQVRARLRLGTRLNAEWGVPPASVAPAGGANQGDGRVSRPSPLPNSRSGIRRPRRDGSWSRGGGATRRPSLF